MDLEPIIALWPILGVALTSVAVARTADIVSAATEWLKVRLRKRWPDLPHLVIHGVNAALSLAVGYVFARGGHLLNDEAFLGIVWPYDWLLFSLAVALVAGGGFDRIKNTQVPPARPTDPTVYSPQVKP